MENNLITIATRSKERAEIIEQRFLILGIACELEKVDTLNNLISEAYAIKINLPNVEQAVDILLEIRQEYGKDSLNMYDIAKKVERILVPIDFSDNSEKVVGFALQMASELNAELMLLNVFSVPIVSNLVQTNTLAYNIGMDFSLNELSRFQEAKMLDFKEKMELLYQEKFLKTKVQYKVVQGNTEDEILQISLMYRSGAIVLGMHGSDASFEKILGSVTEKIIEKAQIPVLVIPEKYNYSEVYQITVLYALNLEIADYKAIKKLINLLYPFKLIIKCIHFCKKNNSPELEQKLVEFQNYFQENYPQSKIFCEIIYSHDPKIAILDYITSQKIDIVSLITHKRTIFESIYNPSITKKILQKIEIPLLVFHT